MSQGFTSQLPVPLPASKGGTGLTATPTNGQLPIGNGAGYTLATLTAGAGASITNGAGTITVASSIASQADMETGSSNTVVVSPGVQQYHPTSCKSWVRYTTVTTTTIAASYNVTSLTDNGTGDTTINFTVNFSSANYCALGTFQGTATTNVGDLLISQTVPTASALRMVSFQLTTNQDNAINCVACFGDQ